MPEKTDELPILQPFYYEIRSIYGEAVKIKNKMLRDLLNPCETNFMLEAHNAISAKIVEEAGFKGIWAGGLTISAALGVRDNNEMSWTQVIDVLEFMSDATTIPILVDGDTGYGNFNNVRRLVRKLEQRNVAGVCIEDKLYPKTNSFINSENQPLADMDEFSGKIKAAKDSQSDRDFVVVARLEAFIAGWGLKEALRRAESYMEAGADAILVHSKKSDSSDIEAFAVEWNHRLPIIIVPTKYYSTPTDKFRDLNINLIIWANHMLRSSVTAMKAMACQIHREQSLINVEDKMASVAEIFRLQGASELEEAEQRYLPSSRKKINAVVLAAAKGDKFGGLTDEIPKTLLKVGGKAILAKQIDDLNSVGIKDITVVRGYAKEKIAFTNVKYIDNDDYAENTEVYSLYKALESISVNTIISYGDIIYKKYLINDLLNDSNNIVIVADAEYSKDKNYHEYITTDMKYSKKIFWQHVKLEQMTSDCGNPSISGEFIGLFSVNEIGADIFKRTLEKMSKWDCFSKLRMKDVFNEILKDSPVSVKFIRGSWLDINSIMDLQKSESFIYD